MTRNVSATKAKAAKRRPQKRQHVTVMPREVGTPLGGFIRLDSLRRVRLELSVLYREARAGLIPPETATKLAYVARQIADLLEVERIEMRLSELEAAAARLPAWGHQ